jgi:PqqA peptide cyclase
MNPEATIVVRWRPEPAAVLGFHKRLARTILVSASDIEQRLASGARSRLPPSVETIVGPALASDRDALAEAVQRAHTVSAPPRSFAVPETLHIEVTGACPFDCPSCYLERNPAAGLSWERLRTVLQQAINIGVLQIAFGGGEPLGCEHLEAAVALAAGHGLGVSVTTSGFGATTAQLSRLRTAGLDHLQVSLPEQASTRDTRLGDAPWAAIAAARAVGLSTGANVVASSPALGELPAIAARALRGGAGTFNLLRPKPVARDQQGWFERNRLRGDDWRQLAAAIGRIRSELPEIRLTLDSALSPVVGLLAPQHRPRPAAGCAAGRRFAAVDRDGRFKPCSHLQGSEEATSLAEYWRASPALAALRRLEETVAPGCRACPDLGGCRGCRAIAGGEAADSDCWRGGA